MPGFGQGLAGNSVFGKADWPKLAVYESVPLLHRELDTEGYLRKLLLTFEQELDRIRTKIRTLDHQTDPRKAQALGTVTVPVTLIGGTANVVEAVDADHGRTLTLTVHASTSIDSVGVGFEVVIDSAAYTVVRIRSRNETELRNTITVTGGTSPPSLLAASTLAVSFKSPSFLGHIGSNFSLLVDANDSEALQRSLTANAVNLFSATGSAKAYEIQGEVSGFDVKVIGLYAISNAMSMLPASDIFPIGSKYYTGIEPRAVCFDDIVADTVFTDPETGQAVTLTEGSAESFIFSDGSSDGITPAGAFANQVVTGTVTGSVALTSAQLAAYQIPSGYEVSFTVDAAYTLNPIAHFTKGVFYLESTSGGAPYYVEAGDLSSYPSLTVITALSPANGAYKVVYSPERKRTCDWCKSYRIRLELAPTQALIDSLGGSGALVNAAAARLVEKLEPVVPIHADIGTPAMVISGSATFGGMTVTGTILP